jgi:hypothetical protein
MEQIIKAFAGLRHALMALDVEPEPIIEIKLAPDAFEAMWWSLCGYLLEPPQVKSGVIEATIFGIRIVKGSDGRGTDLPA